MAEILDITPRRVKGPRANYSEATYGNDIYSCTDEDTCFFFGKEYHVPGLDPTSESYLTLTESGFKLSGLQTVLDNIINNMSTQNGDIEDLESAFNTFLNSTDITDTTINRWKEIENFLTGITDTQTLTGLLESQKSTIDNYTINGKKISTNPTLKATDIEIGIDDFDLKGTMVPTSKISEALSNTSNWLMNQVPYSANIEQDANNIYTKFFSPRDQGLDHCSLTIPSATTTYAGLMSAADKIKFNNLGHTYASGDSVTYHFDIASPKWVRIIEGNSGGLGIVSIYDGSNYNNNNSIHFTFDVVRRGLTNSDLTQIGGDNTIFSKARIVRNQDGSKYWIELYYNDTYNTIFNISLANKYSCSLLTTPTEGFIPEKGSAKEFKFTNGMMATNFRGYLVGSADSASYLVTKNSDSTLATSSYGNHAGIIQSLNDSNNPSTYWWNRLKILHKDTRGYYTELAMPFNNNDYNLYYKTVENNKDSGWRKLPYADEVLPYKSLGTQTDTHGAYVILSHAYDGTNLRGSYFMGTVYSTRGDISSDNRKTVVNVQCGGQFKTNHATYQILCEDDELNRGSITGLYKIRFNNTAYIALKMTNDATRNYNVSGLFDPNVVRVIDSDDANVVEVEALNTTPYIDSYAKGTNSLRILNNDSELSTTGAGIIQTDVSTPEEGMSIHKLTINSLDDNSSKISSELAMGINGDSKTGQYGVYYRSKPHQDNWRRLVFTDEVIPYMKMGRTFDSGHRCTYITLSEAYNDTPIEDKYFFGTINIQNSSNNKAKDNVIATINIQCGALYDQNIAHYQILNVDGPITIAGLYKITYLNKYYIALRIDDGYNGLYPYYLSMFIKGTFDPGVIYTVDPSTTGVGFEEIEAISTTPNQGIHTWHIRVSALLNSIEAIYREDRNINTEIINAFNADLNEGYDKLFIKMNVVNSSIIYNVKVINSTNTSSPYLIFEKFDYDTLQTTYIKVTLGNTLADCTVETKSPMWSGTQADYDAISSKDPNSIYYTFES